MAAVLAQKIDAVTVLLEHGASPEIRDNGGESATDMALRIENQTVIDLLADHER